MNLSLTKAVRAERIKLKRSPVWLAFLALPTISAAFGTFNYIANIALLDDEWYSLWSQHTLFLCYFFMPALFGTYCSYLWRLEHTRHNWNSFLTAPVPLPSLYLGKLSQAVLMVILGNLWIFVLFFVCGKLAGISSALPPALIEWFLCGIVGGIVICSIQLFLSLIIRSFAIPIGIGLAGGFVGLLFTSKGYGLYYPYSLYCMGMRANNPTMEVDLNVFLFNSFGFTLLFTILSILYLCKHEMAAA